MTQSKRNVEVWLITGGTPSGDLLHKLNSTPFKDNGSQEFLLSLLPNAERTQDRNLPVISHLNLPSEIECFS